MSMKKMDLNKKCFFVLNGVSNTLGKHLAIEMCGRLQGGSLVLLIDDSEEHLQEARKEIIALDKGINVISYNLIDWQKADHDLFHDLLKTVLSLHHGKDRVKGSKQFELAFIIHNEGNTATQMLMEPQESGAWKAYVQQTLKVPVALSQEFLHSSMLKGIPKLCINIKSTLIIQPFVFSALRCSCSKARDMYFRSMAAEEANNNIQVLTYSPGILETHKPEFDFNNNVIDICDVLGGEDEKQKLEKLPRVNAQQSILKLINILEEISFISGHDVDYYDTFVL